MSSNDFFLKMCKEAQDELASGEKGWKEADPNTLLLAAFGMLSNHLASRIIKPLWWFVGTAVSGVIGGLLYLFLS